MFLRVLSLFAVHSMSSLSFKMLWFLKMRKLRFIDLSLK